MIAIYLFKHIQILKKQKKAVTVFAPKSDLKTRFEKHLLEVNIKKL